MSFVQKEGLRYFQFESFKSQPLFHAVLTRRGGYSKPPYHSLNTGGTVGDHPDSVRKNHEKIYTVLNLDYTSRLDVWQVHGTKIICGKNPRKTDEAHEKADGILTDNPRITLFMRFADCVPILLWDPVKRVIGLIHAGWQGTSQKIAQIAVETMEECYHSKAENILAGIGPSICQNCYQVGQEVFDAFTDSFDDSAKAFFDEIDGHLHLDLWKANHETLRHAGVNSIDISHLCTACHLEDWYSHRAEKGKTGRFGVVMKIDNQ